MDCVLVSGLNCRPVAASAKKLGLEVHVVDYFGDVDLKKAADGVYAIDGEYSTRKIVEKTKDVSEKIKPDGLLLTSEVGGNPNYVAELEKYGNVIGCDSGAVRGVRDWETFFRKLDDLEIPHPKTFVVCNETQAKKASEEIGFSLIVKPTHGSAGFEVKLVNSLDGVLEALKAHGKILIQEYVKGVDVSVSALGLGEDAKAMSLNKQFLGIPEFGCSRQFQYCGNTVPVRNKLREKCFEIAESIGWQFNLAGSYGVDFVLSEEPYVIEVNPRFQDTLECVEKAFNVNVVELHFKACEGVLSRRRFTVKKVWSKGILYAKKELTVSGDLTSVSECADIPPQGFRVRKDEPVASFFGCGENAEESYANLKGKLNEIRGFLSETP